MTVAPSSAPTNSGQSATVPPTGLARAAASTPASRPIVPPSAATGPSYASPERGYLGRHQFLLRRLHSLTGIVFGGYVVVHLLINATLLEGARHDGAPTVYQQQVDKIHSLPFLVGIEWVAIYLPLLFHTFYGIYVVATGQPNAVRYGYGKNWAYTMQRVTSVILVAFIAFHVLTFKGVFGGELGRTLTFQPVDYATESAIIHLQSRWWVGYVIYPIGILAATFHLSNGFWTAAITWGLTVSRRSQVRWGWACAGLFLFTTAAGFATLGTALATSRPVIPVSAQAEYVDPASGPTPTRAIQGAADVVEETIQNVTPTPRP